MITVAVPSIVALLILSAAYFCFSPIYILISLQGPVLCLVPVTARRRYLFLLLHELAFLAYAALLYATNWLGGWINWRVLKLFLVNLGAVKTSVAAAMDPFLISVVVVAVVLSHLLFLFPRAAPAPTRPRRSHTTLFLGIGYILSFLFLLPRGAASPPRAPTSPRNEEICRRIEGPRRFMADFRARKPSLPRKNHVLLFIVESLRRDHVGYHGYDQETTPFLDRLSHESITFRNHHATSPTSVNTTFSMLTGILPFSHENGEFSGIYEDVPWVTLARVLGDYGYESTFYVSGDGEFAGLTEFAARNGFRELIDWSRFPREHRIDSWKMDDAVVLDAIAQRIENAQSPQLVVGFLMATHDPFTVRGEPMRYIENKMERHNHRVRRYDANVRYLDGCLQTFFGRLETRGLLSQCLVVLTGDHGETFGELGGDHGKPSTRSHSLYHETLTVPLLIHDALRTPLPIERRTSHAILSPLILSWLTDSSLKFRFRLERGDYPFIASDYLFFCNPYTEMIYAVWEGDDKLIKYYDRGVPGVGECLLFNLRNDPRERVDLSGKDPRRTRDLEEILDYVFEVEAFKNRYGSKQED
jgi:arylsulfatase A-like enzyme